MEDGLIPGSKKDKNGQWDLSQYAMPPYTHARAKNTESIYMSIVQGCLQQKGVCAKLYNVTEEVFNVYISRQVQMDLIMIVRDRGCNFYFATPKSEELIDDQKGLRKQLKTMSPLVEAVTKGAAEAALNHFDKS